MSDAQTTAAGFGHRLAATGDPFAGVGFDAIYDSRIAPELARCEAERRQDVAIFGMAAAVGVALIAAEVGVWRLPPLFVIATAMAALVLGYAPLAALGRKAKAAVLVALCTPLGVDYQPRAPAPDWLGGLVDMRLVQRPQGAAYADAFRGRRGKADFAMCSATLTRGSGRNKCVVFQGELFRMSLPRAHEGTTVVLRNSGWLKSFEKPTGLGAVGLEDPGFNKAFAVWGSDQVGAREILTPVFMQQLLDLEAGFAGAHIRCAFLGQDLLIALETGARFEIGGLFTSLLDKARVARLAARLEGYFRVVDGFGQA